MGARRSTCSTPRLTKPEVVVGLRAGLAGWRRAFDAMHDGEVIKSVLMPSLQRVSRSADRTDGYAHATASRSITGSTSGIGRGIAEHFAALGARVVVHGRDVEARRARRRRRFATRGGEAAFVGGDLADEASCRALVAQAVEQFGGLDILVNNAAPTRRAAIDRDGDGRVLGSR